MEASAAPTLKLIRQPPAPAAIEERNSVVANDNNNNNSNNTIITTVNNIREDLPTKYDHNTVVSGVRHPVRPPSPPRENLNKIVQEENKYYVFSLFYITKFKFK
jgi:hypothetical protein